MTNRQKQLIENYVRLKVKKMIKEDFDSWSNQNLSSTTKWLKFSLDEDAFFDVRDIKGLDPTIQKKMKEISDKMELLSKNLVTLAKKSGLQIH